MFFKKPIFVATHILLCAGILFSTGACAQQTNYVKQLKSAYIKYNFSFVLPSGKKQNIEFLLNRHQSEVSKKLFTRTNKRNLARSSNQGAEKLFNTLQAEYISRARNEFDMYINEQASRLPKGISIQNLNKGENLRVSYDGSISKARAELLIDRFLQDMNVKWQELNDQYLDDFEIEVTRRTQEYYIDTYKQHYYVASFSSPTEKSFKLRIDFNQVAQLHASALKPVAEEIAAKTRGLSKREVLNYVSHFIQSIPYDTLNSRNAHGDIGFVAPLTLFDINMGDCDTKSTALAAIIHNLYPELDIKMVLIPNHAFLAIDLKSKANDTAIVYDGKEYVVIEAAGPALTTVGKSYESSLEHMHSSPGQIGRIISLLQ